MYEYMILNVVLKKKHLENLTTFIHEKKRNKRIRTFTIINIHEVIYVIILYYEIND